MAASRPRAQSVDVNEMVRTLATVVADEAESVLSAPSASIQAVDTSLYTGLSGTIAELKHHEEHMDVATLLERLARLCSKALSEVSVGNGLFVGSTGVELAFARSGQSPPDIVAAGETNTAADVPPAGDLLYGRAGHALGLIKLHELEHDTAKIALAAAMLREQLDDHQLLFSAPVESPPAGTDPVLGFAHGKAGLLHTLRRLSAHSDSLNPSMAALERSVAEGLQRLTDEARSPHAAPMCVSWCQGITGTAKSLLASTEESNRGIAMDALRTAIEWVPAITNSTQCCGLSGLGNVLIDAYSGGRSEGYLLDGALDVAVQLSTRSSTTSIRDLGGLGSAKASWGLGAAGPLAFARRLRDVLAVEAW